MEKLDKETLADNYSIEFHGDYDDNCTEKAANNGYLEGFTTAENHYLKLIEEKDKNIQGWMETYNDQTGVIAHQKDIIQQAKELLKGILKTSVLTRYEINEIEEFLKK
jgi:hypothetical protein